VPPDRGGAAGQHEEGRLRGVLGLMLVADDLPTEAHDHRPMSLDQGREGVLIALGGELLEELPIAQPPDRSACEQ
jgi:hypothetical protein